MTFRNHIPKKIEMRTKKRGKRPEPPRKKTAISLFSGAGGMDIGFASAGFEVSFANDLDADACKTYAQNIGPIYPGSLENYLPMLRRFRGLDLVFGGPPCQGFSVAGKMDPSDKRNNLILLYLDVVSITKPRMFVCENVKALAALSRWKTVREGLMQRAADLGYHTALIVLNSSSFGAPQNRERMFLIGIREPAKIDLRADILNALKLYHETPPTIGDLIRRLGRAGSEQNRGTCKARITFARDPILRKSPYAGMLFNGAGRPLRVNGVSSTLPASMGGNKTPIVDDMEIFEAADSFVEKYHKRLMDGKAPYKGDAPARLRRLTVSECLAIQTFPPNYNLAGTQSAKYRQIGNAVPCKMAAALGNAVFTLIEQVR